MPQSFIQGFPRIGRKRELKFATEAYWSGASSSDQLAEVAAGIRAENWRMLAGRGVDLVPSNDFTLYDQVLDAIAMVGAVPARYHHQAGPVGLDTYFAMARGRQGGGVDAVAMEMTKWFDTNYHYIVPELEPGMAFSYSSDKAVSEFLEAKGIGVQTTPVLVGPVSFLLLGKSSSDFDRLELLGRLLAIYEQVLAKLGEAGAEWVHMDEPCFVQDRSAADLAALKKAYQRLAGVAGRPKIAVKTYFDHAGEAAQVLAGLPVEAVGLDFVYGPQNEDLLRAAGGLKGKTLLAGVVDGRNVWINDFDKSLELLTRLSELCDDLVVSTSCSLIHTPIDVEAETGLDPEVKPWLAFAQQKVDEVLTLTRALSEGSAAVAQELAANREALQKRRTSNRSVNPGVRSRVEALSSSAMRNPDYEHRRQLQSKALDLPLFPTTTIGSYPQTEQIRKARANLRSGAIDRSQYQTAIKHEIEHVIRFQEQVGLDVLVHGEPERNDMVQYFAEQMDGYLFTEKAWVQSYGSRYVRPPILYGDVHRPQPMTVEWTLYAQSLTSLPVKGMLTGPVTMLQWSFVRDDQPLETTCTQLAIAIRDEVQDLEAAGFKVIQVDEAAFREGLPLRSERKQEYLDWAVRCFRLTVAGVADETHIQMHMCYSDFGDILEALKQLDADVALIEASRSNMELLEDFAATGYGKGIGPGVYDIHSPRVPTVDEMAQKLRAAADTLGVVSIWVNPDCGLKTRGWVETEPSLKNMVEAAHGLRKEYQATARG
jgi:5-methyltetrahydropteroyltriglutamate--homocysteine methyltransferase